MNQGMRGLSQGSMCIYIPICCLCIDLSMQSCVPVFSLFVVLFFYYVFVSPFTHLAMKAFTYVFIVSTDYDLWYLHTCKIVCYNVYIYIYMYIYVYMRGSGVDPWTLCEGPERTWPQHLTGLLPHGTKLIPGPRKSCHFASSTPALD